MARSDVLIVGAGPTGLVLALWLTRLGVSLRIIDSAACAGTTSRALAVQARTLELYRQLDLTARVLERGYRVPAVSLWVEGERRARLPFENIGGQLTAYPFLEIFPQDEHELLLIERLAAAGVRVERGCTLLDFTAAGDGVRARLQRTDGTQEQIEAKYIAGCDGARSRVRELIGTGFPGGTYRQLFYVADIRGQGPAFNGELNVDLDEADFLAVFPLAAVGRARLIGTVLEDPAGAGRALSFEDVSPRALRSLKLRVEQVHWFSTYHVHHRVTARFRHGRALLLGDAAHIHSPAGGQGMNTGIGDAINLAWKLAAVLAGSAPETLLDSYEAERMPFAERLVQTTDRVFSFATADGPIAELVRTRLAPLVLPRAVAFESVREFIFRTVSQIMINYRGRPLSEGSAGSVHGGDRLPWVNAGGADNYAPLSEPCWQIQVYGEGGASLRGFGDSHGLPVRAYAFTPQHEAAGLARGAMYLLRPDTYVALAAPRADPALLEGYFAVRGIAPGGAR